ncbi:MULTISPECIES: SMI1/KNR4 family protein [Achromobacter]|uniref:SMI1/KNR4 family protein n=1 Tax=Achromobacter TaxID=222 RepID=UPI001581A5C7|nr:MULTISPECIES: SMI1/KNR4 family protein [Achromobacter]MBD9475396.1 SMI1/KNR4 family protein [Achromobacter sp. ACM01]
MGTYDDLVSLKGSGTPFDKLRKMRPIVPTLDKIPQDYVNFIADVGAGELGDARFMLYDGLIPSEEIYGKLPPEWERVLIFGDDFSGCNSGFRVSDWSVVEINPSDMEIDVIASTFQIFIRGKIKNLM